MELGSFGRTRGKLRHSPGFTFIEVIVTAVIVAVLAAVAVPVYNGYITNQREGAAKNLAQATAAAAGIFKRRTDAAPVCDHTTTPTCTSLLNVFLSDPNQYWIDIAGTTVTVTDQYNAGITGTANF